MPTSQEAQEVKGRRGDAVSKIWGARDYTG